MRKHWAWLTGLAIATLVISLFLRGGGWLALPGMAQAPAAEPAAITLSGTYADPQDRFQIGLAEGFTTTTAGGSPVFFAPDGSLAYSVVVTPLSPDTPDPMPEVALLTAAQNAFGQGEGFQTQEFGPVPEGGLNISWSGRFSQGSGPPQPVQGQILAKRQGDAIFLLMVAALEAAQPQLPQVTASLAQTLQVP